MRMLMAVVLVLVAGIAVAQEEERDDRPPIWTVLQNERSLESEAAFWFMLRNAALGAGVQTQYITFCRNLGGTEGDTQSRRAKRMKLTRKPHEWHDLRVPSSQWPAVVKAFAQTMGKPMVCSGDAVWTREATWVFWEPWKGTADFSFAVTLSNGSTDAPGTAEVLSAYGAQ